MHAIPIAESHLLILDLNRDGHQDRIAGNAHEVGAIVEVYLIADDSRTDNLFEIRELNRRRLLYLYKLLEPGEFILAFEPSTDICDLRGGTVGAVGKSGFSRHAHLFQYAQSSS